MMPALNTMVTQLRRRALETEDWLRYHPVARGLYSQYQMWSSRPDATNPQTLARTIVRRCAAARLAGNAHTEACLQEEIVDLVARLDGRSLDWNEFVPDFDDGKILKGAVLKPYLGPSEKGVVFIAFENQWIKLLNLADLDEFARRYTVVIGPSGSPHNRINYVFPAVFPDPVFTLISNPGDRALLPRVSPRFVVVPLYASSWVNPDRFTPLPHEERPYDLIMVANFGKFKRHRALFAALRRMPAELRVLLIGQDQDGRTAQTIREEARWYGVADRFELRHNQDHRQVADALCQARASVVLSRREGSCVAIAESLFADTPAAMLEGAEIGSRVFINHRTGRFLSGKNLARELTEFSAESGRYRPRLWAEQNISCFRSTRTLNEILLHHALQSGQCWTRDIVPMQRTPEPEPVQREDRQRLAAERADIHAHFGVQIGPKAEMMHHSMQAARR
jgi:glycosyltransferase involved in cell wall biosynthesis